MDDYSALPPALRPHAQHMVNNARSIMEGGDTLLSVAMVGRMTPPPRFEFVGTHFTGDNADEAGDMKDTFAEQVRARAVQAQAEFVILVSESWLLAVPEWLPDTPEAAENFRLQVMNKWGSIGASPYKRDTTTFMIETRTAHYSGIGDNVPKGDTRTFTDVEFRKMDIPKGRDAGRFMQFLPPQMKGAKS